MNVNYFRCFAFFAQCPTAHLCVSIYGVFSVVPTIVANQRPKKRNFFFHTTSNTSSCISHTKKHERKDFDTHNYVYPNRWCIETASVWNEHFFFLPFYSFRIVRGSRKWEKPLWELRWIVLEAEHTHTLRTMVDIAVKDFITSHSAAEFMHLLLAPTERKRVSLREILTWRKSSPSLSHHTLHKRGRRHTSISIRSSLVIKH